MPIYRVSLLIEDEIRADSIDQAYQIVKERLQQGFYGPTREHFEEIPTYEEETSESVSSEEIE